MRYERITLRPEQMGGQPCIRGLRIPVATVVAMMADGMSHDEIAELFASTLALGAKRKLLP